MNNDDSIPNLISYLSIINNAKGKNKNCLPNTKIKRKTDTIYEMKKEKSLHTIFDLLDYNKKGFISKNSICMTSLFQ